jgi:hypothetical protein
MNTTTATAFEGSVDEVRDILQTSESDTLIISKPVELVVKALTKPDVTEVQTTLEKFIKNEIKDAIVKVVTPIDELPYIPPASKDDVIYVDPVIVVGGGSGGGGGGAAGSARSVVGGFDPYSGTYSGNVNNMDYIGNQR